jgi:hypothetical protein
MYPLISFDEAESIDIAKASELINKETCPKAREEEF